MIHYDFEQGTPEWLESRKGVITGSKFRDARDRLKNGNPSSKAILYAQDVARERCGGTAEKVFQNAAMRIGSEQEQFANAAYEGIVVIQNGVIKDANAAFCDLAEGTSEARPTHTHPPSNRCTCSQASTSGSR